MSTAQFKLDMFEGPLDLLLHLISKHKLNIYDIEIAVLLEQYLEYMAGLEEEDYEDAADFLEMAARLIYIKTVSLLPKDNEGEALKKELEGSLIEYSLCKMAAARLQEQYAGGEIFVRNPIKLPVDKTFTGEREPEELLNAYFGMSEKARASKPLRAEMFRPIISKRIVSVTSKIIHVLKKLITQGECCLDDMYDGCADKSERVAVFLAVLELTRSGRIFLNDDNTMVYMNKAAKNRRIESSFDKAEEEAELAAQEEREVSDEHETETQVQPEDSAESSEMTAPEERAQRYMPEPEFVPLRSVTVHRPSYKSETRYAEGTSLLTIEIPEETPETERILTPITEETPEDKPIITDAAEPVSPSTEEYPSQGEPPEDKPTITDAATPVSPSTEEHPSQSETPEDKPIITDAATPVSPSTEEHPSQSETPEDKPIITDAATPVSPSTEEYPSQSETPEDKPIITDAAEPVFASAEEQPLQGETPEDKPAFRFRPNYFGRRSYWGSVGWTRARLRIYKG